jgi:hypothetical protein
VIRLAFVLQTALFGGSDHRQVTVFVWSGSVVARTRMPTEDVALGSDINTRESTEAGAVSLPVSTKAANAWPRSMT